MTVCRFVGFTADDPSLYESIDYDALARDLDRATSGWGTDEKKVAEVFAKAVGIPLMRLMPRTVSVFRCHGSTDGMTCTRGTESNETFLNEQARRDCGWQDVGPEPYREAATGDFERDIADRTLDRLERSLAALLSKRGAVLEPMLGSRHPLLEGFLLDEVSADDALWLLSFGGYACSGNYPLPDPPADATREECRGWLLSGKPHPTSEDIAAAGAVCAFLQTGARLSLTGNHPFLE